MMAGLLDPDGKGSSTVTFLFSCKSVELYKYIKIIMTFLLEKSSDLTQTSQILQNCLALMEANEPDGAAWSYSPELLEISINALRLFILLIASLFILLNRFIFSRAFSMSYPVAHAVFFASLQGLMHLLTYHYYLLSILFTSSHFIRFGQFV